MSPVPAPRFKTGSTSVGLLPFLSPRFAARRRPLLEEASCRSCLSSNRNLGSYSFSGGHLAMRRSRARAGQRPHGFTSLAHFKSFWTVLRGFHMPSKSSFPLSYCCTQKMDAAANFLIKPVVPSSETVTRISSSKSCRRGQTVGGVHPDGSSGTIESSHN